MSVREKEAELVFRGEQYARALTLFQNKNGPGTSPPSFDLLVDQKFLRKKYKDPIANDDFVPILLAATTQPGAQNQGTNPTAGTLPGGRAGAQAPGAQATQRGGAAPGTQPQAAPGNAPAGGIMGVSSKSKAQSIRLYKGRNHYNEWQFMPVARTAAPGAGQGAPGAGGQRGNRGNPQGPQNPFGGVGGRQGTPPIGGRGPLGPGNPPGPNNPNGPNRGGQQPFPFPTQPGRSGR